MSKSVIKVSSILSIFIGIIECIYVYTLPAGIISIIGGCMLNKYYKMKNDTFDKQSDTFLIWSVALSFTTFIPGLLCLIYYIKYVNKKLNSKN